MSQAMCTSTNCNSPQQSGVLCARHKFEAEIERERVARRKRRSINECCVSGGFDMPDQPRIVRARSEPTADAEYRQRRLREAMQIMQQIRERRRKD